VDPAATPAVEDAPGVEDALADAFGAAVTATVAAATGLVLTSVALTVDVSVTDETEVAPLATEIWACSWRVAAVESTVPRSQVAVPSWLPQPRENLGFWDEGVAVSPTVTLETAGTPAAHTLTT